jgi:hypothetical protein
VGKVVRLKPEDINSIGKIKSPLDNLNMKQGSKMWQYLSG